MLNIKERKDTLGEHIDAYFTSLMKNIIESTLKFSGTFKLEIRIVEEIQNDLFSKASINKHGHDTTLLTIEISEKRCIKYTEETNITYKESVYLVLMHEVIHFIERHYVIGDKNEKIWHMACDMYVNSLIDLKDPFVRPESYGFMPYMDPDIYYELIVIKSQEDTEKDQDSSSLEDGIRSSVAMNIENSRQQKEEWLSTIDEINDFDIKEEDLPEYKKRINKDLNTILIKSRNISLGPSKNIDGLDLVIKEIIKSENQMVISSINKEASWYKLNNRRKSRDGLIMPGKEIIKMGTERRFSSSSVVFIDTSGSTSDIINSIIYVANTLREKCGSVIVDYNSEIKNIFMPNEPVILSSSGITSIRRTLEQYKKYSTENHLPALDRVYVITDGKDSFEEIIEESKHCSIWVIKNEKISKLFSK